jgi:hypothetical protein
MKQQSRHIVLVVIVLLYTATWVGGYYFHVQQLAATAEYLYANGKRQQTTTTANGAIVSPDGPTVKVVWCVPILPGLLFVNSYYEIGCLWAQGGMKIVFFYGCGAKTLRDLTSWTS